MISLLLYSLLIMSASLVGVFFLWKSIGQVIERHLSLLVSFSAGVFLVVVFALGRETLLHSATIIEGVVWIVAGVIFILTLFSLLPAFHHHHDEHHEDEPHSHIDARRIVLGDAIHNIGDGVLLATTFIVSIPLGVATAMSIFIHEFVQESSEFFVLRQAGLSSKKALVINFIASSTILIGSIGGYLLLDTFSFFEVPLLGISTGAFLVIVFHDLIPDSVRSSKKQKKYTPYLVWFSIGVVLMSVTNLFFAHPHGEDTHSHDHSDQVLHEHDHEVSSEDYEDHYHEAIHSKQL